MAAAASALRPRQARQAAPLLSAALAVAYAVAATVALKQTIGGDSGTTYAAVSVLAHAADLSVGLALLAAGVAALLTEGGRRLGAFATSLGVLWFAPDWEAWAGQPLARSLGSVAAPFFLVVVFHFVLAAPRGRLRSPAAVAAVGLTYTATALFAIGRALLRDPFLDQYCLRNCVDNVFLVHADERIAHDLNLLLLALTVAIGLLILAVAGVRLARASAAARRALTPILVPAAFVGIATAAYAAAIIHMPFEEPRAKEFLFLFFARSFAVAALVLGIGWRIASDRRTRSAVARLTADLGEAPAPGNLQNVLADAVGDPTLRVAYWLEASHRFVGANGNGLPDPAPEVGRAVTPILRRGRRLAVVTHDAGIVDGTALERELRPAARLAVENERLQAEVLAELDELRRSRSRIVERGDRERQRLERNLHDGAQQHLLALFYDLRLARSSAEADDDAELMELVESAVDDARAALEELRELAHGIYPAILAEAGLGPALETLADEASLPVEVKTVLSERQPPSVEAAAYFAVAEAVADAAARAAVSVRVGVARAGEWLVVAVEDDGGERSNSLSHVADRVGALGGLVELGPTTLRASIPCA